MQFTDVPTSRVHHVYMHVRLAIDDHRHARLTRLNRGVIHRQGGGWTTTYMQENAVPRLRRPWPSLSHAIHLSCLFSVTSWKTSGLFRVILRSGESHLHNVLCTCCTRMLRRAYAGATLAKWVCREGNEGNVVRAARERTK